MKKDIPIGTDSFPLLAGTTLPQGAELDKAILGMIYSDAVHRLSRVLIKTSVSNAAPAQFGGRGL